MYSKAKIFNLTLGALLLSRTINDPDTDESNENKVLLRHWDVAFRKTLADLDLESTSTTATLELLTDDTDVIPFGWLYAYKYPSDCMFMRRIDSESKIDNRTTSVPKQVKILTVDEQTLKVILTDQYQAAIDYISRDVPLNTMSAPVGMCIAYNLAELCATLIVGKGAAKLKEENRAKYVIAKAEAKRIDALENFNFVDEATESEFVEARIT